MKTSKSLSRLLLVGFASLLSGGTARAQDPVEVAPQSYRVLLENEQVRVLEYRSRPGDKTPMHSHPAYLVYDIDPGTIEFTFPDGRVFKDEEEEVGDVSWSEPKTHASENVGTKEARALIVELKEGTMKIVKEKKIVRSKDFVKERDEEEEVDEDYDEEYGDEDETGYEEEDGEDEDEEDDDDGDDDDDDDDDEEDEDGEDGEDGEEGEDY